ncbi:MAG: metabolite traffic protein EboE [Verrucomicrobiota bacterium]
MQLKHGLQLAYCTNVHPGETWAQTLESLNRWTLPVREQVCPHAPYAIGLRLSDRAARELSHRATLLEFKRWLDRHDCYVFTINGFPFGQFHGTRVKESVYRPDWTDERRLEYTNRLFDLLAELLPAGLEGSVSTLPGSFKEFINSRDQERAIRDNVWRCVEHIARTSERSGHTLHLGLEPEPFGLFENSAETARFFDQLRAEHPQDTRLDRHLGVNYDTCHFAVEFETPQHAVKKLQEHGIRLSKIHLSNALKFRSSPAALARLRSFADDIYLHQAILRTDDGALCRYKDLDLALASPLAQQPALEAEWRVHFHVPLHSQLSGAFGTTADHLLDLLPMLQANPTLCSHLEMETYTWAVLPEALRTRDVAEQIVAEYQWTLRALAENGLA